MTDAATTPSIRTYSVPEISCGHCKSTIEAAVQRSRRRARGRRRHRRQDGHRRRVDDEDAIVTAIEDAGYDVVR